MKTKGQHRGHCQRCGAIQVVLPNGMLADHGYRVIHSYFQGTCQGSHELPLQVSRVITDAIITAMLDLGDCNANHARSLRSGTITPEKVQQLTQWGAREYAYEGIKQIAIMMPWDAASSIEQKAQVELEAGQAESDARFFRSHAKSMSELAADIHGTDLIDREAEELARVTARKVKSEPIIGAYRTKIAKQRELEALSNQYSKLRRVILDRCLVARNSSSISADDPIYWNMPFDLHNWRAKHTTAVIDTYPELASTVEAIEILVKNREEIKARPVIK